MTIYFYATGVAYGDTVSIIENDGQKYANEIIEVSGHSTLRIWFNDETYVSVTRNELQQLGCSSEISDQPKLVAVDVPPDVDYQKVQAYLDIGFKSGRWDYEEACLGF
ncbi:DUF4265 domain-containing protein [Pseudovibrio denitrificans]|uniref:DUF4265 domain-containing protein n=1 Tax=Pseudovibrio denitrificans TaxID=258256 RepID=UPI000AD926AE|nr:DUF4265 domain-containing protein [Pseudovibrio denitrificans]